MTVPPAQDGVPSADPETGSALQPPPVQTDQSAAGAPGWSVAGVRARAGVWLSSLDRQMLTRLALEVLIPLIAIRIAIMVFAWIAVANQPGATNNGFGIWNHWDGPHFLEIAATGYGPPSDPARIVLFPLYPASIVLLEPLFAPLDAAMLSSLIATVLAAVGLYQLVRLDSPQGVARLSVIAMAVFPTAYAFVAPYSEALFLALSVWAFVAVRRDQMMTAGILGALAAATRIQGVFIAPALLIEYLVLRRRIDKDIFWIFFVGSGLLLYLGINWYYFHDPLYFVQVQKTTFFVQNTMPWEALTSLWNRVSAGWGTPENLESWVTVALAPLVSFVFLAVVTVWAAISKRSRPSYAVYTAISLIAFSSLSWPISVPRYILGVFPIFIAIGSWSRPLLGKTILIASVVMLAAFTRLFVIGHWAF